MGMYPILGTFCWDAVMKHLGNIADVLKTATVIA